MLKKIKYFLSSIIVCSLCSSFAKTTETIKINIGSGSILKGYYSISLDLCSIVESLGKEYICEVVPTDGGIHNLELLNSGKIDFALMQSNIAYEAFNGIGFFKKRKKMSNLRQVLNLYNEFFTVITRATDKINIFSDLEGKTVSNGPDYSSTAITFNDLVKYYNFKKPPKSLHLSYEESLNKLCKGSLDAIVLTAGHPNALVSLIINTCDVDFIPVETAKIELLVKDNKSYQKDILHQKFYRGISANQNTISIPAILITTTNVDTKFLDKFIGKFHKNRHNFRYSSYLLENIELTYFADTRYFVLPKHNAVRNRN